MDFPVCYTGRPVNSVCSLSFTGDARLDHLVKLESIRLLHFTVWSKLWCDNLRLLAPNMFYSVVLASIDDLCLHLLLHWGLQKVTLILSFCICYLAFFCKESFSYPPPLCPIPVVSKISKKKNNNKMV